MKKRRDLPEWRGSLAGRHLRHPIRQYFRQIHHRRVSTPVISCHPLMRNDVAGVQPGGKRN